MKVQHGISDILNQIDDLYSEVLERIEEGHELSPADVKKLARLSKRVQEVRDLEIVLDTTTNNTVPAKKWGISQARVSQIRISQGGMRKIAERMKGRAVQPHAMFRTENAQSSNTEGSNLSSAS
jgi:hypothetical protein